MNVVILGAASGIATEIEKLYAARGAGLGLVDIKNEDVEALKGDLLVRGAVKVETAVLDLSDASVCVATLKGLSDRLGGIDVLILAYGILGNQAQAKEESEHAERILVTDFTSAALWLLAAAKIVKPSGAIAVFSSVAGDRGRQSNYVYGAAKGGLALLAQGMAHDLAGTGPHIIVVKPGFVDTPMTAHLKKGGLLWSSAQSIARIVVRAIDKRRGPIVYVPGFWRWVMLIIRLVPAAIFHRTKL